MRKSPPSGYIDFRSARDLVRRRMFAADVPVHLVEAAKANIAYASNPVPNNLPGLRQFPSYPEPLELIADAVRSGNLTIFLYTDSGINVFALPAVSIDDLLRNTGFTRPSRKTVGYRFMDFYPRSTLDSLDLPTIREAQFERFALCFRETAFDDWMADTARQQSWPLDAKPRRGRGRPERVSAVKGFLKAFIEDGQWRQGLPLKTLFHLINSKLGGQEVDRETIKKAMAQLYAESGQFEYRYVPRKRSAPKKSRPRRR